MDIRTNVAVLDANVLYPAPLRDFLLRLAEERLYFPKWSDDIHDEWTRNILMKRPDIKKSQLIRTCQLMDESFEEANVKGYRTIISALELPDKDDRHVLAVAIKSMANLIVTFNLKDFPAKAIRLYTIEVFHPDDFVELLYKINPFKVLEAFSRLVSSLKKPPQTELQVLTTLTNCGLIKSVSTLRKNFIR